MIAREKLTGYKEQLLATKKQLLAQIKSEKSGLDFGNDVADTDEEADEAEELGNELAVERVLKGRLLTIEDALLKIEKGTYGKCEKCDAEIQKKVLDTLPESRYCENCKQNAEKSS